MTVLERYSEIFSYIFELYSSGLAMVYFSCILALALGSCYQDQEKSPFLLRSVDATKKALRLFGVIYLLHLPILGLWLIYELGAAVGSKAVATFLFSLNPGYLTLSLVVLMLAVLTNIAAFKFSKLSPEKRNLLWDQLAMLSGVVLVFVVTFCIGDLIENPLRDDSIISMSIIALVFACICALRAPEKRKRGEREKKISMVG